MRDRLVTDAPSVVVISGDRTLVGPPLDPAYTGAGRDCWSARRVRARAGGSGGRSGGRTRRAIVRKADNVGTGNDKSSEVIGVDVWPLRVSVHSGKGREFAGGRLVRSSVLHVDLTTKEII